MKTKIKLQNLLLLSLLSLTYQSQAAVHISQTNQGQAIIFPYFTVANGLNTLFSVSNEQNTPKAVKVNIREGLSGAALYSFNVYLGEQDTWTMVLLETDGFINLISNDESCVLNLTAPNATPTDDIDWQTGMIEVIEMANFIRPSEQFFPTPFNNDITPEENCQTITAAWEDGGVWASGNITELTPVTGGLTGQVSVFDVANGFSFQVPSVTLDDFFPSDTVNHFAPDSGLPDLSSGDTISATQYQGTTVTTQWPTGYEALSALLMKTSTSNDFTIEPAIDAKSERIISFPTLAFHFDNENTTEPFMTSDFNTVLEPGQFFFSQYSGVEINERSGFYDREGIFYFFDIGQAGPPPPPSFTALKLNSAVNTIVEVDEIPFADGEPVFPTSTISGEPRNNVLASSPQTLEGVVIYAGKNIERIQYEVNNRGVDVESAATQNYHGLPFIAFAYSRFTNANAQPGLLATYATAKVNRSERRIE